MSQLPPEISVDTQPPPWKVRDPLATNWKLVVLGILGLVPMCNIYIGWVAVMAAFRALADGRRQKLLATLAGLMVGLIASAGLLAAMGSSMRMPPSTLCRYHLYGIRGATQQYQQEHGQIAPDLETLAKAGLIGDDELTCPGRHRHGPRTGYFYRPCATEPLDRAMIACDVQNHGRSGKRSVLTSDGMVRLVSDQQFELLLKEPQNAEFAEAFRAALAVHSRPAEDK